MSADLFATLWLCSSGGLRGILYLSLVSAINSWKDEHSTGSNLWDRSLEINTETWIKGPAGSDGAWNVGCNIKRQKVINVNRIANMGSQYSSWHYEKMELGWAWNAWGRQTSGLLGWQVWCQGKGSTVEDGRELCGVRKLGRLQT